MPTPGSNAYDKQRARLRKEYDNEGVNDQKANERANEVLQGERSENAADPKSRRDPSETRSAHPRGG